MRKMRWTTCLWPGLPQLWLYGSWVGLAVSVGMAAVLDLLLVISLGWSELIGANVRIALWGVFGVIWVCAAAWSARQCGRYLATLQTDRQEDAFPEALDHYLKGDYYQAEHILRGLLDRNPRDIDARLMLATLLRHINRCEEAFDQLDVLARFEDAGKWELEMQNERELLAEKQEQTKLEQWKAA